MSSVTGAAATAPALSAGLQSVILSSHKKAAIINGQEILLGEKVGEAKLVEINETCVVLMGAQGRQVLQMFPSVTTNKNEGACSKKTLPELMPAQSAASASGARLAKMKHRKRKSAKPAATCVAPANNEGSGK